MFRSGPLKGGLREKMCFLLGCVRCASGKYDLIDRECFLQRKWFQNQILHDIFMENSKRYEKWGQDTAKVRKWIPGWAKVKERAPKVSQGTPKGRNAVLFSDTGSQKWASGSQKWANGSQKWAKRTPKGAKGSQKGAKREPKVSQRATKMHQKINLRKRSRKGSQKAQRVFEKLLHFGSRFPSKVNEKNDAKIDA